MLADAFAGVNLAELETEGIRDRITSWIEEGDETGAN